VASSGSAGSSSSSGGSGSTSGGSTYSSSPLQLMGRMVSEQRVALQYNTQLNQGLVRSAAARASGLEYEEFELRLQVGGWQGVPPAGREPWCACCSPKLPALSACHQW
jgi:hypothetical protein